MLEGELEVLVGEDSFLAAAGSFVHLPINYSYYLIDSYYLIGAGH